MMTTADLKNRNLKTGIGYEKKDVDTFLEEIIASYEELYRSNIELNDRVNSLNEGLQHYKTIEASLQKTLILAERTAEETVNEAKEKAKQIEDEAKGNTGSTGICCQTGPPPPDGHSSQDHDPGHDSVALGSQREDRSDQ